MRLTKTASAMAILALLVILLGPVSGTALGQQPQVGFPSLDTSDGKFVALAGSGLNTVAQPVSFWIGLPSDQGSFTLDVFDGDLGGFWDVHDTANAVKVNYILYADPLKNGQGTTVVAAKTNADFSDDAWGALYSGSVHGAARSPGGNLFYRLSVSFSDTTAASNEVNGFKVRVNGQVGTIPGTFGFVGAPINVDVLTGRSDPIPGTTRNQYNGEWHWYVYAPSAGLGVILSDTDADSRSSLTRPGSPPDDCSPGATCFGITPDIRYEVLFGGSQLLNVTSPSGDQETVSRSVTTSQPGFLDWHWTGVDGHNLVFISSSHEMFSSSAQVPLTVSSAAPTTDPRPSQSTIKGRAYVDANCDGAADAGEGGLEGVTVTIDSGGGWTARTISGPDGQYEFAGLSKGKFNLAPSIPSGYAQANPASREKVAVDGFVLTITGQHDFGISTQTSCGGPAAASPPAEEASGPWPPRGPARTWYMAEGHTGPAFETWLLVTNPGSGTARTTVTYFPEAGVPVSRTYDIMPAGSLDLLANETVPDAALGAAVVADQPITVERTMLFNETGVHRGTGSSILATRWHVPDIDTAGGFESWVLVMNPNNRAATVALTFARDGADTVEQSYSVAPSSRLTIFANSLAAEATGAATVQSDLPVIVERSTYWDIARRGNNSLAVP